jgi:hypothetical protein
MTMAKETRAQKKTVDRVMHEFKHGELESGPDGKAGKVRDPKQAIAIALSEAGVSNRKSSAENARSRSRTKAKEAKGQTAQQVKQDTNAPEHNRAELYEQARTRNIPGRSKMSKAQLERALHP